jgi:hypothetical protein
MATLFISDVSSGLIEFTADNNLSHPKKENDKSKIKIIDVNINITLRLIKDTLQIKLWFS